MLALSGCAAPGMGIDLRAAPLEVQILAAQAQAGDKDAQLQLGIRFEKGNGVPRDPKRARQLYRRAAASSGGTLWVYSPAVGKSPGQVMPIDTGMKREGLPEASRRLRCLNDRDAGRESAACATLR